VLIIPNTLFANCSVSIGYCLLTTKPHNTIKKKVDITEAIVLTPRNEKNNLFTISFGVCDTVEEIGFDMFSIEKIVHNLDSFETKFSSVIGLMISFCGVVESFCSI
jgi:hypothetical protein